MSNVQFTTVEFLQGGYLSNGFEFLKDEAADDAGKASILKTLGGYGIDIWKTIRTT